MRWYLNRPLVTQLDLVRRGRRRRGWAILRKHFGEVPHERLQFADLFWTDVGLGRRCGRNAVFIRAAAGTSRANCSLFLETKTLQVPDAFCCSPYSLAIRLGTFWGPS